MVYVALCHGISAAQVHLVRQLANWSRNGVSVAAGETVDSIARLAEAESTEPHGMAGDFATRWPGLPKRLIWTRASRR
jgi:hypothetical protein